MRRLTRRRLLTLGGASVVGATRAAGSAAADASQQSEPYWPSYGFGAGNTGLAPDAEAPTSEVGVPWRYGTDVPVFTTPVIDDGRFHVVVDGFLYARDLSTRSHVWRQDIADRADVRSTPAIGANTIYAGGDAFYALSMDDGSIQWRADIASPATTAVTLGGNGRLACVGDGNGVLHAFDTTEQRRRWQWESPEWLRPPAAVRAGSGDDVGTVVVASGPTVTALRADDGSERWTHEADDGVFGPVIDDLDRVVFATASGTVELLDLSDGSQIEDRGVDATPSAPPTVFREVVLVPAGDAVYALAPDGLEFGTYPLEAPVVTSANIAGGNNTFVVADRAGTVYAFSLESSSGAGLEWHHQAEQQVLASPVVAGGRVYVPTDAGVVALDPEWADRDVTVTAVPPVTATRTRRPDRTATPTPAAGETATATGTPVPEANPDPSQWLPLPDGLPMLPISGVTLLGAAGVAALARRMVGDDTGDAGRTNTDSGSTAAAAAAGSTDTGGRGGGESRSGGRTGGSTSDATDGSSGDSTGSRTSGTGTGNAGTPGAAGTGAGSGATAGGRGDGADGERAYPVGDPSGRPDAIPTTPDLDLSYDDLDRGDRIGAGGNADVYHATAPGPDGPVDLAVKEPRTEGTLHAETVERVVREAETWAELDDHEAIVGVVDWGSEPLPWIAMEYMDAGHLGAWLDGERSLVERLWVGYAVVRGVRHAHRHGVAHLDLKPANVLFRSTGPDTWPVPKVADWGLSKHLLDHSNSIEGLTPAYAAPEQFESDRGEVDNVTDVYQLGAVLYELFAGRPPFEGTPSQVMHAALNEAPDPPSAHAPGLPEAVDEMVLRALATDRSERYDSVLYLRDDIREIVGSL